MFSTALYRDCEISKTLKPIPSRAHDYDWQHMHYGGPGDDRYGSCASVDECVQAIDDMHTAAAIDEGRGLPEDWHCPSCRVNRIGAKVEAPGDGQGLWAITCRNGHESI